MQDQILRPFPVHFAQKTPEIPWPGAGGHLADDVPGRDVERGVRRIHTQAHDITCFTTNLGSRLILNVLSRCGRKSAAFHTFITCRRLTRACLAISRVLQCVPSCGIL